MKLQTVYDKMQEYVQNFREQLAMGDTASVAALAANSGSFFRELMQELPQDAAMGTEVNIFITCVERFGAACAQRDMEGAAETLAEMETVVSAVGEHCGL